jgi:hypothetical protein
MRPALGEQFDGALVGVDDHNMLPKNAQMNDITFEYGLLADVSSVNEMAYHRPFAILST